MTLKVVFLFQCVTGLIVHSLKAAIFLKKERGREQDQTEEGGGQDQKERGGRTGPEGGSKGGQNREKRWGGDMTRKYFQLKLSCLTFHDLLLQAINFCLKLGITRKA